MLPLRPELVGVRPYGAPQLDVAVQLNVNENPYPPSPRTQQSIVSAVADVAERLNRYPDREASALRADLAAYLGHGLTAQRVWAANGSNEVMLQVLQAFGGPGRTALSFSPTYSMYPEYARATFTRWVTKPRSASFDVELVPALRAIDAEQPSVVLLASPNNPTGNVVDLEAVRTICRQFPGTVIIMDEAYAEFRREGTRSAVSLLDECPNLAVTRTMSKAFAFAGGRLGYLASSADVVDALRVVRLPYHLSSVTQAVARAALANADDLLARVADLRDQRDRTVDELRGLGLEVADSDANFVLFGRFLDRHAVWQGVLDRGVLIREVGPDGWLRVSIGTAAEMESFFAAVRAVLEEPGNSVQRAEPVGARDQGGS
ncbi:MAG TPA: histidinol-phosphate transaminase [Nocardioidaceae bacterium]|nr:histidinol-phosphate transaminase [Nocardioidaceae bacterium]